MMRPAGPLPCTYCSSMPKSQARRRTAGEAIGLSPGSRVGGGCVRGERGARPSPRQPARQPARRRRAPAGAGEGAAAAASFLGAAGGAPSFTLPAPSTSRRISSAPTAICSPTVAAERHDLARHGRRNLHRGLVGHHVGQHLVLLDRIARLHMPGHQFDLGNAFADVGHLDHMSSHGQASIVRLRAAPTRSGPGKYAHSCA